MERQCDAFGHLAAATAMLALAGAFAAAPLLLDYPVYAGQALRYAVAHLILTVLAYATGRGHPHPTLRELGQLTILATTGLALFNVALVEGLRSIEPATMGTIVGASPIVLATVGPWMEGRAVSRRLVLAALSVVAGTSLTYGAGAASGRGLFLAIVVLACEASFSLLAVPLLPRLGPLVLSAYVTGIAASMLSVAALVQHPLRPVPVPGLSEATALGYLALVVTAFAFLAWYTGIERLGAARAGLFVAVVPVASAVAAAALGTGVLRAPQIAGASLVALGLLAGTGR